MQSLRLVATLLLAFLLVSPATVQATPAEDRIDPDLRALEWREVGPYRGGRSAAVTGIPSQHDVFYFGSTGGGVWKTTDGGKSWNNVSDGYFGGSIGAVAVSEWDPNVIYVGGGEKTVRGNVSHGDGIWKSTDAGESWSHVGLGDSRHVPRIRIHPRDPELVYVAALGHLFGPNEQRGVYRSRDGGNNWEQILYVDDEVGAADLIFDPTNPRILYATFWRVLRTPYSLESGGPGSSLWKSTDGGDSWTELTDNEGLPEGPIGISGITVSPTNPRNLYAIIEANQGGVFRSRDAGKTWKRTNKQRDLRQRAWYYTRIYADPADEQAVYVTNVRFHHSKDGGKTFTQISTPHGDNHDLWIAPDDPLRMIEANDGGANVSYDGGKTWSPQTNQPTAQMYRVSVDESFPYRLLGGQQDNSTVRIRSRSAFGGAIGVRDWEPSAGGESGHVVAKPDDPDVVYGGSYDGFLTMVNHRTGERRAVNVWPDNPMGWGAAELKHRFQWNFPIFFSPHDADLLYTAAERLFRSRNGGASWQAISPDLTRNDKTKMESSGGPITKDNTSVEYYGTIFAALESPHERGVLWAGTDDGLLQLSRDGGQNWSEVTPRRLPEWTMINSIEAHPFEPGGLYVAATRYKLDDFRPYLYRTTDYGASWTEIGRGIDRQHFTRVIRADPERRGLLYAGTERGVYMSADDGGSWEPLQLNLPIVPITDLVVKEGDLVAATQGRGYWILDDLSVLRQRGHRASDQAVHLYEPRPAYRLAGGRGRGAPQNMGKNPPSGVVFYYRLADEPADEATFRLELLDGAGETIQTYTKKKEKKAGEEGGASGADARGAEESTELLEAKAGLNRFVWNLRYPGAERFPKMVLWNRRLQGPTAVPGAYRARLTVGEQVSEVPFDVLADPRSSASGDDLRAQFDFLIGVRDKINDAHRAIRNLRQVKQQLTPLVKALGDAEENQELRDDLRSFEGSLEQVERTLYQTKLESPQDPLNFPIRLNDKLAGLLSSAGLGAQRPTRQLHEVRDELGAAVEEQLDKLNQLLSHDLEHLNQRIRSANVPALRVPAEAAE